MIKSKQIEKFNQLLKTDLSEEAKQSIKSKIALLQGDKIIVK
jgi:hypothetical protein